MKLAFKRFKNEFWDSVDNKYQVWYTIALFLGSFGFGVSVTIYGACLTDVQIIYNVEQSEMSWLLIAGSVGYAIGTLSGLLYRWLNRQLMIIIFTLIIALTCAFTPLYRPMEFAYAMSIIQGVSMGVFGSSYQMWFLEMWPRKIGAILQVNTFMFGLGTVVAPAISSQFVLGGENKNIPKDFRLNRILVPYVIAGIFQAICPILLLILFFVHRYRPKPLNPSKDKAIQEPQKDDLNTTISTITEMGPSRELLFPTVPTKSAIQYRKSMLTFGCIFFSIYYSAENGYLPYCTTMWQFIPKGSLTAPEANTVMTVLSSCYTIGPLVTAFVSVKLEPEYILSYHYVIMITGFTILFFGQTHEWLIYTGSAILGYGFSVMQGTIFSFVNRHFNLTDLVTSVYLFTASTVLMSVSVILIKFPLNKNPQMLFNLLSIFIGVSLACFITIKLILMYIDAGVKIQARIKIHKSCC